MAIHTLTATQVVPADIDRAWSFFSRPENLGRITPSSMDFRMRTENPAMSEGALIDYTVKPVLGIPMPWRTRIEGRSIRRSCSATSSCAARTDAGSTPTR